MPVRFKMCSAASETSLDEYFWSLVFYIQYYYILCNPVLTMHHGMSSAEESYSDGKCLSIPFLPQKNTNHTHSLLKHALNYITLRYKTATDSVLSKWWH